MRNRMIVLFSLIAITTLLFTACDGVISENPKPAVNQSAPLSVDPAGNSGKNEPDQPDISESAASDGEPAADQGEANANQQPAADLPTKPELGFS